MRRFTQYSRSRNLTTRRPFVQGLTAVNLTGKATIGTLVNVSNPLMQHFGLDLSVAHNLYAKRRIHLNVLEKAQL